MIYCHHKPLETDYIIMINGIIIYIFVLINENIEQDRIKGLVGHEHFFSEAKIVMPFYSM